MPSPVSPGIHPAIQAWPLNEVWGVGSRLQLKLQTNDGIKTIADLQQANPQWIRQRYSVVVERIVRELNGESCVELADMADPKQQIMSTRSLGHATSNLSDLEAALAYHVRHACRKLRQQHSKAQRLGIMIRTHRFLPEPHRCKLYDHHWFVEPTDDPLALTAVAHRLLQRVYNPAYQYHKVGVFLADLSLPQESQRDLFAPISSTSPAREAMLSCMDQINQRFGRDTLRVAAESGQHWKMRQQKKSPAYTTDWSQLRVIGG